MLQCFRLGNICNIVDRGVVLDKGRDPSKHWSRARPFLKAHVRLRIDALAASFEMLRDSQSKMFETMTGPMTGMPGFDAMRTQQKAFLRAMTGGWSGSSGPAPEGGEDDRGGKQKCGISAELPEMEARV